MQKGDQPSILYLNCISLNLRIAGLYRGVLIQNSVKKAQSVGKVFLNKL